MNEKDVICFQCGQAVGDPPALNRISEEENCSACAERVLAAQPGIFPDYRQPVAGHVEEEVAVGVEELEEGA